MGPGDDAALVDGTAVTVDTLVEGVHFDERLAPADVGFKALAVSVSDLASMAARPAWAVLALCVPSPVDRAWVEQLAAGLGDACRTWSVRLVGGDTTGSPGPRFVSLTLAGPCPRPLLRSGGRPGDRVWVTGHPGLAGAGYVLDEPPAAALAALRRPRPPLEFGLALPGLATAAMDLSDGLAADLPRLAAASGTGARLVPGALPLHPALADLEEPLPLQVAAGDDYELLFTAPPEAGGAVRALAAEHGIAVSEIGRLTADPEVVLEGRPWPKAPFAHFEGGGW